MNKQDAMQELNELKARADALEKIINEEEKPEFELGTFGKFWDKDIDKCVYGALRTYREKLPYPFGATRIGDFKHFQPITEAILPPWIEHDGGAMPVNSRDLVVYEWSGGDGAQMAGKISWDNIRRYRIIKKASS